MNEWRPATESDVQNIMIEDQRLFTDEQRELFDKYSVSLERVQIRRFNKLENAFIVAKKGPSVLYYEDVEEGFNVSHRLIKGIIEDSGCEQDTLGIGLLKLAL